MTRQEIRADDEPFPFRSSNNNSTIKNDWISRADLLARPFLMLGVVGRLVASLRGQVSTLKDAMSTTFGMAAVPIFANRTQSLQTSL